MVHGADQTLSSHRAFDGKLIHVRRDAVLPCEWSRNGASGSTPGSVAIVPVTIDREVILVQHYRHAVGKSLLELPAGTLDHPGESPANAARRELLEETGYTIGTLTELMTFFPTAGYSSERITLFLAEGCQRSPDFSLTDEITSIVPVARDSIRGLLAPGPSQVQAGMTIIGLFWLLTGSELGIQIDG